MVLVTKMRTVVIVSTLKQYIKKQVSKMIFNRCALKFFYKFGYFSYIQSVMLIQTTQLAARVRERLSVHVLNFLGKGI